MKDVFPDLIGNKTVKLNIGHDILNRKNSHAYIIEGDYGCGKKTIARYIASAVSCEHRDDEEYPLPCGECGNCSRVRKDISGDVVWINSGEKASIGVDVIRNLRTGLYVTPNDSDMRTYIIESAEKMTDQAQNALLLTLEEPPSFVMFLLLTEDSSKLLETIRSRAQIIRCEVFSSDAVAEWLRNTKEGAIAEKRDANRFNAAVSLANGSLGKAKDLLLGNSDNSQLFRFREYAAELVSNLCSGNTGGALKMIAQRPPKNSEEAKSILNLADNAVRDLCVIKKTSEDSPVYLTFFAGVDEARSSVNDISYKKLIFIHECIVDALNKLFTNVSVKTSFINLALKCSKYHR